MQSGLLFVAVLLSVPGFRHVGAQDIRYNFDIMIYRYKID
jgi:hypothetical protein